MDIIEQLKRYIPTNEQEKQDKIEILRLLENQKDIFSRNNKTTHMTASAWVVNEEKNKVLMAYHNIYDSWSWLEGHADGDENLISVVVKEVMEESGLNQVTPCSR